MANPLDFTGKTVLVVGGTSGIGNGIAHGFREQGAAVYVTGTRASARNMPATMKLWVSSSPGSAIRNGPKIRPARPTIW